MPPDDKDIVICMDKRNGVLVYVLQTSPGMDAYVLLTQEKAIAEALSFAKCRHARAWVKGYNASCVLIADFRETAPV